MPWPDHMPAGEAFSAINLLDDIVFVCQTRLASATLPPLSRIYYELILSHAHLCRVNHAHGLHRDIIRPDGTGEPPNPHQKLDNAWNHVSTAHGLLSLPSPTLGELNDALEGIDHGGGGGGIV